MAYKQFNSVSGKKTDILHSRQFVSKSMKQRKASAFDKRSYVNLSPRDKALLNGYAFARAEQDSIFRFKNSKKKVVRTTTRKKK